MTSRDVATMVGGRTIFAGAELVPTADEPVLAVDVEDGYGAFFTVSVDGAGDWSCDCTATRRGPDGRWEQLSSGGAHGGGWATPWRPPAHGWPHGQMLALTTTGLTVGLDDDAETEAELIAVCGFLAPEVTVIEARHDGTRRLIPVTSRVGAFVVVAVGNGSLHLTPMDERAGPVGPGETFSTHA